MIYIELVNHGQEQRKAHNHKEKGMDAYSIAKLMETKRLGTTCNHAPNQPSSTYPTHSLTRIDLLLVAYDSTRTCYFAFVLHHNLVPTSRCLNMLKLGYKLKDESETRKIGIDVEIISSIAWSFDE